MLRPNNMVKMTILCPDLNQLLLVHCAQWSVVQLKFKHGTKLDQHQSSQPSKDLHLGQAQCAQILAEVNLSFNALVFSHVCKAFAQSAGSLRCTITMVRH